MEVSAGDYGRMMFEMMLGEDDRGMPDHWKSIRKEAEPLVRKLLALNSKMSGGGYQIHGYVEKKRGSRKKKVLSSRQRIRLAQEKMLEVEASSLAVGDHVWLHKDYDLPMENFPYDSPVTVEIVTGEGRIMVEHPHGYGRELYSIDPSDLVLKAPADWDAGRDKYFSEDYWLREADRLGI